MDSDDRAVINLLTSTSKKDPNNDFLRSLYKRHGQATPIDLIIDLREDASNTLTRVFTGSPHYGEIVEMVAEKMDVKKGDLTSNVVQNELLIIRKMVQEYVKKHPEAKEKLDDLIKEMGNEYSDLIPLILQGSAQAFLAAVQALAPDVVATVVIQILWRFAGMQTLLLAGRLAAMLVPFLNVVMGAWLLATIAGPAYRKLVPSVVDIALLRLQENAN